MSLPIHTYAAVLHLTGAVGGIDYQLIAPSGVVQIADWRHPAPQPSEASIVSAVLPGLRAQARTAAADEATRRAQIISPDVSGSAYKLHESIMTTLIAAGVVTGQQVNANLTEPLRSLRDIDAALTAMRTEITGLTTVAQCEQYIAGIADDAARAPRTVDWP